MHKCDQDVRFSFYFFLHAPKIIQVTVGMDRWTGRQGKETTLNSATPTVAHDRLQWKDKYADKIVEL